MSAVPPPPDWAALFKKHRDSMYRVAARVLREAGRESDAEDAVSAAMISLMSAPPAGAVNWEALFVATTRRRALDILRSAAVAHAATGAEVEQDVAAPDDLAADVADLVDRRKAAAILWDKLAMLDTRHRKVAYEYLALGRPRQDVANELGVTPPRVSQMATAVLKTLRDALEREGVKR